MPLYEVLHSASLSVEQRKRIAFGITKIHCGTFAAPSIFVNVRFAPATDDGAVFVGGAAARPNHITAHIRRRATLTPALVNVLTGSITTLWNDVVYESGTAPSSRLDDAQALHSVFVMDDIAGGAEQGFLLPSGDMDEEWVQENMERFKKRAEEGDGQMKAFLEELKKGLGSGPA